ncbi:heat shock protein Hsp20 [Methanobacterium lacus]|uniref:Heat shock protein Hsp20 n=1 Tax=Methanobacterium lacus (strain AL-21) TaxID=877455 RepID=F0TCL1_METLA|nr:Hsp20/alpha crystallin family protein [Methanobacterium lacus]ADZ09288.1 heat shock protein Hsp20 [Methanobacterium lacus]
MSEKNLKLKPNETATEESILDEESEVENELTTSERSINDILSTLKDKQEEFSQMISDYSIFNKRTLVDVIESTDSITIIADLPRLKNQDIEIAISEDSVDICAEMQEENTENVNYILRERSYGKIRRSIKLPSKVVAKDAEGTYKDAVLTIKLPKKQKNILRLKID